ncbi:disease resistance protein At4g27190-like [Neltuma alba]|uniref:disease resistance protein At4g27190-like n=1 Tax=Neltuma alba TaxID=207710 RepID=UPI0010A4D1E4|nr:disease resistance protein At4g27190-like [Prosopis alba]
MDCETMIELPLITKEEAWDLFKKHANLCNDPSNMFGDVGEKIVDECKGLPIAIVVVGRSLRGKNIEAWESALWRLKHFQPLNVGQGFASAYACLELSYSNLPSSTAKSLLLLCSMFPEDHEIHKEDLIRFGMRTLELEESIVTIEDARRVIFDALEILLDSSLLMSIEKETCVKLHDLVRDVALWIAKKQGQVILVDSSEVSNILLGNRQNLKDIKALSLWDLDDNFKLLEQLHCSTLEILLLQPDGFIEDLRAIKALKVLALIEYGFEWGFRKGSSVCSIPQSIVSLTYLHTLCIRGKKLGDISLLGELKTLEILDLRGSLFDELPVGIVDMKMLKLLDIYDCRIEKSPIEVIGRCEQLEELYLSEHESVIPHNFSLSRLKRYVLYDSTCSIIRIHEFDPVLEHLHCRGEDPFQEYLDSCGEALRALCIQDFRVSALNSSMKNLILRANHLWLENCEWDYKDINLQINHLGVSCCQEKKFIIEKRDVNILQTQVFSRLSTLRLFEMNSLEQVFQDSSIGCSLPMLQELWIWSCPELRICIFSHATITSLPKLKKLHIDSCDKVKWLVSYSLASYCPLLKEIIISNCSQFEKLIDEEAAHGDPLLHDKQYYPYGKETDSAYVGVIAKRFNQLQNEQSLILFLRLESLQIKSSGKKKGILEIQDRGRVEDDDESIKAQEPLKLDSELSELLPKIKKYLHSCYCCKPSRVEISSNGIFIKSCSEFEGVIGEEAAHGDPLLHDMQDHPQKHDNDTVRVVKSELRVIWLEDLPKLEYIWKDPIQILSFHRLESIKLLECPRLRNIFTVAIVTSLPELRQLDVRGCNEWEGIFCEESLKNLSTSSTICFPKLESILTRNCHKVRRVFSYSLASHCPSLKRITVENCYELEGVVVEAYEGEVAAHHHQRLFPKLSDLELMKLPKLREIYEGYEFNLLSGTITIEDCPNISKISKVPLDKPSSSGS